MSRNKKYIILGLIILAVVFVITTALKKSPTKYKTTQAKTETIMEKVEATGTINPVQTVTIGAQVSGQIKKVYVDFNSHVTKGQLLAQIDTSLFQAQVDQAQATLASKKAAYKKYQSELAYKKANFQRYKTLLEKDYKGL